MKRVSIYIYHFLLSSLLFLTLESCNTHKPISTAEMQDSSEVIGKTENEKWVQDFNAGESLSKYYFPEAYKFDLSGTIITGHDGILESLSQFRKTSGKLESIYTLQNIPATQSGSYEYEIGGFTTEKGYEYRHMIIWNVESGKRLREIEIIGKHSKTNHSSNSLNSSRQKWIELCNLHNADNLISRSYTSNAIYYNHNPPNIGTESITAEYAYMNDLNYNLLLTPIISEIVNENIAFEIGQCSGSYNGKYMIVWQQESEGLWKVLFDSNI